MSQATQPHDRRTQSFTEGFGRAGQKSQGRLLLSTKVLESTEFEHGINLYAQLPYIRAYVRTRIYDLIAQKINYAGRIGAPS